MDDDTKLIDVFLHSAEVVIGIETGADVALHSHTVDVACLSNGLQHLDDVSLLGILILVVIVIEELYTVRCVLPCKLESLLDVILADGLEPVAVSHAAVISDGFVDNVPSIDDTGVVLFAPCHDCCDIVLHTCEHELSARELSVDIVVLIEQPGRCLRIPDEGVASHRDAVLLAEIEYRLCRIEIQRGALVVFRGISEGRSGVENILGLELVLGCNRVELCLEKCPELFVGVRHD